MTYDALETSVESGRPVYLYQFTLNAVVWRYTSADEPLTVNGFVWEPLAISDDGISQSGEASSDTLTITAPIEVGPAQMFMGPPPSKPIQVAILHKHEGDAEAIVCYSGEVSQIDFGSPGIVSIACISIGASMQRDGLRLGWQRLCPYALYDPRTCRVDRSLWVVPAVVESVVSENVTLIGDLGKPNGYFNGGYMEWEHPIRGWETRMIEAHHLSTCAMFGATDDIATGMTVYLYPGCARTVAACAAFNNSLNYGGCAYMPGKSPFDGTPVF